MIALVQDNNDLAYVLEKFLEMEHIPATSFPSMIHFRREQDQVFSLLVVSSDCLLKVGIPLDSLLSSPVPTLVTTAYDEVSDWCSEHNVPCLLLPFTLHRFLKCLQLGPTQTI
ncbi:hypothetical protein [Ktedonospora formicarum]|uniref:Uncharacterized protein n=1 Tax=Ktedonospora formicarum TaxID=2778364 RepID=A0A8J3I3A6_9CHLR|nr:hypothetical protein [Ktedonospora formicarum]GHO47991.1 hypothetical protein KSX_61540 [Ktedonospora formicarum]